MGFFLFQKSYHFSPIVEFWYDFLEEKRRCLVRGGQRDELAGNDAGCVGTGLGFCNRAHALAQRRIGNKALNLREEYGGCKVLILNHHRGSRARVSEGV